MEAKQCLDEPRGYLGELPISIRRSKEKTEINQRGLCQVREWEKERKGRRSRSTKNRILQAWGNNRLTLSFGKDRKRAHSQELLPERRPQEGRKG